jgi:hypothetical protein
MADFMTEQEPLGKSRQRRYDPARHVSGSDNPGSGMSTLVDDSTGDWSWKPRRRLVITGPLCTCSVHEPVGINCARHDGTYKPPTKNPLRTVIILN